jgi:hypothetical protein
LKTGTPKFLQKNTVMPPVAVGVPSCNASAGKRKSKALHAGGLGEKPTSGVAQIKSRILDENEKEKKIE